MTEKKYSKKHEWLEVNGSVATVGITAHAASQLGDIVFAEVPAAGNCKKRKYYSGVVYVAFLGNSKEFV